MKKDNCKNCTYDMADLCRIVNNMIEMEAMYVCEIGELRRQLTKALGHPPESRAVILTRRQTEGSIAYFLDKLKSGEITKDMFVLMIEALMEAGKNEIP